MPNSPLRVKGLVARPSAPRFDRFSEGNTAEQLAESDSPLSVREYVAFLTKGDITRVFVCPRKNYCVGLCEIVAGGCGVSAKKKARGFYGSLFTSEELVDIARYAADPSVSDEIGILKVLIRRVVEGESDPAEALAAVRGAIGPLCRLMKIQADVSAGDGLPGAVQDALDDLGDELGISL